MDAVGVSSSNQVGSNVSQHTLHGAELHPASDCPWPLHPEVVWSSLQKVLVDSFPYVDAKPAFSEEPVAVDTKPAFR